MRWALCIGVIAGYLRAWYSEDPTNLSDDLEVQCRLFVYLCHTEFRNTRKGANDISLATSVLVQSGIKQPVRKQGRAKKYNNNNNP